MKRLLTLMVAVALMSLCAKAEHLTFMGIPIDGSPAQFEQALLAKGFTPANDINESDLCKPNQKWFNGVYFNKKVMLAIYYTPKSKKVRAVGLTISNDSDYTYSSLCKSIEKKYPDSTKKNNVITEDSIESDITYLIGNIGGIGLSRYHDGSIVVSYTDTENTLLYQRELTEDI